MKSAIMKDEDYAYLRSLRKAKQKGVVCKSHIEAIKKIQNQLRYKKYMNSQPINPGKLAAAKMDRAVRKIQEVISVLEDVG